MPSDDEVEVITEWLAPSEKQEAISSPHVPVIQRPTDGKTQQDQEKVSYAFTLSSLWVIFFTDLNTEQNSSRYKPDLSCFVQALLFESSPTKAPSVEASGDPSAVQENTVAKATKSLEGSAGHGINGNRMQKKSLKELKRARMAEDVHILDASKEGNVGRFINVG